MLLVAEEEAALAGLERACAEGGSLGRVLSGPLFLCPEAAAGKSVASINATDQTSVAGGGSNGVSRCSLIWRRPETPTRSRNSWSIQTSGMLR
jgi:hypothetical protein